jgi:SAM-dependent methyltransferase
MKAPMSPPLPGRPDEALFASVFGRVARFGRRWDEGLWRYHEVAAVKEVLRRRPGLAAGPILDLGCGDGELFGWIFGPRPDAAGVDSGATRQDDVQRARTRATYCEVRAEDAARTSFEDGRFALVFSNSVLEHISPIEPVLAEVRRVLAPGGHFLFTTPDPLLYSAGCYGWRRLLGPIGLDRAGRLLADRECRVYHHVTILDGDAWRRRLEAAGLALVERVPYLPLGAARPMTLYSGASRVPGLAALGWATSRAARSLARWSRTPDVEWIAGARQVLGPLLAGDAAEPGCGQLILARTAPGGAG